MTLGGSPSPSRRIRFAPLPDPRRSVLITDDGNEVPFPQHTFATQFPAPPTPSPILDTRTDYFTGPDTASLSSSSSSSKRSSDPLDPSSSSSSTPGTATPISITTTTPSEYDNGTSVSSSPSCSTLPLSAVSSRLSEHSTTPVPVSSKSSSFSFFRRLKRRNTSDSSSSTTLTPVTSIDRSSTPTFSRRNFSAEEILTLGTINLFRASSSRDTSDNETASTASSSWGWSLTRLSSTTSSASHHRPKEPTWGHPLTRASSTQSYQSKSKANKPKPKKGPLVPRGRKGTRLLNGRVYGVKPNENPFANARDDEPEFVEWGYGGMGSVKGATHAGAHSRWDRLHGTASTGGAAVPGEAKPVDEDEDTGSGMAWIKKRREQREKEKQEKEEKERLEREPLEKAESADIDTPLPHPTPLVTVSPPVLETNESIPNRPDTATESVSALSPPSLQVKEKLPNRPASATSSRSALSPPLLEVRERVPSRPGTATSAKTTVSASSSITVTPSGVPTPRASVMSMHIPLPTPTLMVTPPMSSSTLTPMAASVTTTPMDEEHVTRAINIPAPAHHYHHRPHSRAGSKDQAAMDALLASRKVKDTTPSPRIDDRASDSRSSTSVSESESDEEEEYDDDGEEDEEDESSDEEQREKRKTALGAGVEKISRHHST